MHHFSPLLGPVVALVAWTLFVMFWMLIARGAEFRRLGIDLGNIPDGARGIDLEGRADARAQWKSHNYSHLLEQPTIFYAVVFALVLMGFDSPINLWLAWAYVGFRVLHSIIQCTSNKVRNRLAVFVMATFCLVCLTAQAAFFLLRH